MARAIFGIVGLVIGLALGFLLGSGQTPETPEVDASRRDVRTDLAREPAPIAVGALPASVPVETERAAEPGAPPAQDEQAVPDATITGVVVDTAGRPIPFARVSADIENAPSDGEASDGVIIDFDVPAPRHAHARATRDGRFALGGLQPGALYLVRTEFARGLRADIGRNWELDDRHVGAPSRDARLTYSQGILEIELIDPERRERVPACAIEIATDGADPWRDRGDSDTKFKVGVPVDRRVRIAVDARGFETAEADGIVVSAADPIRRVTIPLVPRGSGAVRLTVRDDLGRPQRDVVLDDVTDRARIESVSVDWKRSNPEAGLFVLVDLRAGMRVVRARGNAESGLVPGEAQVQVLESGESNATIVLLRGGRLRVTVTATSEAFAQARLFDGEQRIEGSFRDEATRQDVGDQLVRGQRYLFEAGLAPGTHRLRWERGNMGHFGNVAFRSIGAGRTNEVEFVVNSGEITDVAIDLG